jgi:hypothetical protein
MRSPVRRLLVQFASLAQLARAQQILTRSCHLPLVGADRFWSIAVLGMLPFFQLLVYRDTVNNLKSGAQVPTLMQALINAPHAFLGRTLLFNRMASVVHMFAERFAGVKMDRGRAFGEGGEAVNR